MTLIQGFTRRHLEAALADAGAAGDSIGAAALQIALHQAQPATLQQAMQDDLHETLAQLSHRERQLADLAAVDLKSWVQP